VVKADGPRLAFPSLPNPSEVCLLFKRLIPAAVAVALLVVPAAASASASADAKTKSEPVGAQRHCAIDLSNAGKRQCFSTAREAISKATGGAAFSLSSAAVTGASKNRAAASASSTKAHSAAAASYLIGVAYYWQNYGTPALYFYGDHPCTTTTLDADYGLPYFGINGFPASWDNNIRSFTSYNNCWTRVSDWTWYLGESFGYTSAVADLGGMNDRTSSILWS